MQKMFKSVKRIRRGDVVEGSVAGEALYVRSVERREDGDFTVVFVPCDLAKNLIAPHFTDIVSASTQFDLAESLCYNR